MEKINIAELLRDSPKGMELDCTMYQDVTFNRLQGNEYIIINRGYNGGEVHLTKFGQMFNSDDAKCVIFPKGKTTWEGFQRPFKDGDVIATTMIPEGIWTGIFKQYKEISFESHCCLSTRGDFSSKGFKNHSLRGLRLATEEEKAKFFKAIKDNGYRWNPETKTLEKLIKPKFKVGDRIKRKNDYYVVEIIKITEDGYYNFKDDNDEISYFNIEYQDNYELVPNKFDISTLKPFDKVLVRNEKHHVWFNSFFGLYNKDSNTPFVCCNGFEYKYCIPYEGNEHLLGTANDCDDFYKTWEK